MHKIDADKLRELRRRAGLSQKELAEKLGINPKNISHYENSISRPSADGLISLLIELGADASEIAKKV